MPTLNTQVWISQLMENFYPDTSFLNYARDFSTLVDNDKINLAEAGIDPEVLVNNTAYPIAIVQRVDNPIEITLDLFETKNTLVRRPEVIEYAYNQLESVLMGHRNSLRKTTGQKAAHAFAPQEDTADTPIIEASGAANADMGGVGKRITIADVLRLKRRYDDMDCPLDKRFLVLHPAHLEDLILEDTKSFKDIVDLVDGMPKRFAGFNVLQYTKNAWYTRATAEKKAYGSAPDTATDAWASFSFYGDEVMKADGNVFMYVKENDPEERGTIVGFDKRFVALPIRNKAIGAIIS